MRESTRGLLSSGFRMTPLMRRMNELRLSSGKKQESGHSDNALANSINQRLDFVDHNQGPVPAELGAQQGSPECSDLDVPLSADDNTLTRTSEYINPRVST